MKRLKYMLSLTLMLALLAGLLCTTAAGSGEAVCSSDYISIYSAGLTAESDCKITVTVDVDATRTMTQVGASSVTFYRSTDQTHWTPTKTYNYEDHPKMMGSGMSYYKDIITHYGVPGYYYFADVTCYAGDSSGHDTRVYTTNIVRAFD